MPRITIEIAPKLDFLLRDQARYKVAHGGRGSAKSWSVARSILVKATQGRLRCLCAREFQSSIKESVHFLLESQINLLGLGGEFEVQRDAILGPHGSQFLFAGLHDKSLDGLKSYEDFDLAWIEEGQSISRRSLQILRPTIRRPGSEIWITINPENEEDAVWQDFILDPPHNAIVRKVSWFDNPWFNEILEEERRQAYERDADSADWIWGGNCRKNSDRLVLRGKCEVKPFTPLPEVWDGPYQGQDYGFGQDPMALVRCWIFEGDLYIEYEAYGDHCEIEDHVELMDSIPDAREFVTRGDNSRPELISYLRRNGYKRAVPCLKWPGCVEDRIGYLRSFHKIYIHPRCPRIDHERKLWAWKSNKAGDILNVLLPGNDHGWDAVGYALEPFIRGYRKKLASRPEQAALDDLGHPIRSTAGLARFANPDAWMA